MQRLRAGEQLDAEDWAFDAKFAENEREQKCF